VTRRIRSVDYSRRSKNNVGQDVIGYAFTIETVPLADNIETSRILWEQEAVTITAEDAHSRKMSTLAKR
jgi:hypothetical protein